MPDGSAILRIAFGPAAPTAAISTLNGLYYMDPSSALHANPWIAGLSCHHYRWDRWHARRALDPAAESCGFQQLPHAAV